MRRLPLMATALFALLSCSESEPPPCQSDDDCPNGYTCDRDRFAGDCVQKVYVIPCGESFCEWPFQTCVDGEQCVENSELPDGGAAGAGGVPVDDGGAAGAGGEAGGGGEVAPPDAAVDVPEPRVLVESPFDGSVFLDGPPVVSGQVLNLVEGGRVTLEVDDVAPGQDLPVDDSGRFMHTVRGLQVGDHSLTVVAEQGPHRVEQRLAIRVDFRVRVRGGQLQAGDQPFRFVAVNTPSLLTLAFEDDGLSRVAAVLEQAAALGVTVVRARAYDDRPAARTAIQTSPGMYSEPGLLALDRMVAAASAAGIKLILPLLDDAPAYGGIPQYLQWNGIDGAQLAQFFAAGNPREQFKAHARTLLDRTNSLTGAVYREDPTIMAWEIIDGLDARGAFRDATGNQVNDFLTDVSQTIKATAPDQLVATGDIGFDTSDGPYGRQGTTLVQAGLGALLDGSHGAAWIRNLRIPTVDISTLHVDPEALGFPADAMAWANLGAAWMRGHASIAALEGKPLVVTLARMPGQLDLAGRRGALQAWTDEVISLEISGMVVGNLYPAGQASGDPAGWSYAPDSDPADAMNQFADLVAGLAADLMR